MQVKRWKTRSTELILQVITKGGEEKMLRKLAKTAQSTAEYAIIIAVVVGAAVAMQVYVKRGIQGRVHDVVDYVGNANDTGAKEIFKGGQYEPYYLSSAAKSKTSGTTTESMVDGGAVSKSIKGTEQTDAVRKQVIGFEGEDVTAGEYLPE